MTLVVVIIILALIFDYINGFHDAANSIATVVSTKVLTPFQAVLWAALFNFAAFWLFKDHAVANTISKTVHREFITLPVIFSGILAAIFWNLLTWWYGIPSSSSHTLIGGFAGAAITHAFIEKGTGISWKEIVESDTIIKTILFIFLAPVIGMLISIFITFVTIMRNVWLRILIIAITTSLTVMMFDKFEHDKLKEEVGKFFKIDKYNKEIAQAHQILQANPNDSAALAVMKTTGEKLKKTMPICDSINRLCEDFERLGPGTIAKCAYEAGWLNEIGISKLKDEVRNANSYLVLESLANEDTEARREYGIARTETEKYKEPLKKYLEGKLSIDSTMTALNTIYPIKPSNYDKVKQKISKFNIERSFQKEIEKADNSAIVWGIIFAAILFCLAYLYAEFFKTPSAYRTANMFKKLQLFSSAAFSIGHGGNDAQKVMGIIGAALIANGSIQEFSQLPNWVPFCCYLAIGLGTMSGGWKIVKTMGTKITKVTPLEGVAAETAGAFTLFFTGQMGIPVSTTHTITGSIIGVGATKRLSAVRWGVTVNLLWAWIITIPVSAILASIVYLIVSLFQ